MRRQLKELYLLLTVEQRKKLVRLQILVVIMSIFEIAGVVSIGPFMALVSDPGKLTEEGIVGSLYYQSGFTDEINFLIALGIGVLLVLTGATLVSMYTIWKLSMYGASVGAELANRLYKHYMYQPWLFHSSGSSDQLTNKISQECQRVTNFIIQPIMQMNAKLIMSILMVFAIFVYNPKVAIMGLLVFGFCYYILFYTVRKKLSRNGKEVSESQQLRFKLMSEGFGGIKDVLILGRQETFVNRFSTASNKYAKAYGTNQALSQAPRYAMELIAFGSVISLILYLLVVHKNDLTTILPLLSVYALAGFKILPAFQQVYSSVSQIRANLPAFSSLRTDLIESSKLEGKGYKNAMPSKLRLMDFSDSIKFTNVTFSYPSKKGTTLNKFNLEIRKNQVIGLVGASGSGKSTAIDMLLGLIEPNEGMLQVDGVSLSSTNKRAWQNCLGFVPQSIFLSDNSIRENIAFGLCVNNIDDAKIDKAIRLAQLEELVLSLPNGLDTRVGERGIQLSGGQRQRIGIARALYYEADVLILDEATSALDGITEKLIMKSIHDFSGEKTIIMIAHRLSTLKNCDCIYFIENGVVTDRGDYSYLIENNQAFKKMDETT